MGNLSWSQGYRKVGKKARRGKRRHQVHPHTSHRKKRPNAYEAEVSTDRRRRLVELRAKDLDLDQEYED